MLTARCWVLALSTLGCGARPHAPAAPGTGSEVTLYRDRAIVRQRVEVIVPADATATRVALAIAAGVDANDLVVLDPGGLVVANLRIGGTEPVAPLPRAAPSRRADPDTEAGDDTTDEPAALRSIPTAVELVVSAPRPGRYTLSLGYTTDRLAWQAAYTLTTTAARDRATLRGALAIHNTAGIAFSARTHVVDANLGPPQDVDPDQLRRTIATAPGDDLALPARDLGTITLGDGETRVQLLAGAPPCNMHSVLVYDPIGTELDHPGSTPVSDPALGAAAAPPHVTESLEIERDPRAARGLPAGPVRLLERRLDDTLLLLGESQLFTPTSRAARVDTIALGIAAGVVAHRERRDWGRDDLQRRFSEELLLTIENARSQPVEIILREHLYRGQNWTLAYQSAPATKEGPQQIALRTTVPANGSAKVLYVVVYTW